MKANFTLNPSHLSLIGKLVRLLAIIVLGVCVSAFQSGDNSGRGWRVWIRTEPCPGRHDWLSVSKEQPGGGTTKGSGTFWQYDHFLPAQGCTEAEPFGCTFEEAKAVQAKLQFDEKLKDFCCRDYSVWRNSGTGKMSIVVGKFSTAGPGWQIEKADLCCEEAEALSGLPNACSGPHAPPLGNTPIAGRTPGNNNTTTGTGDRASDLEGTLWLIPSQFATLSIFKVKPDNTVEAGHLGDSEISWTGTYKNKRLELQNPYYAGSGEYERIEATVDGSSMTGHYRYKVYTDKSDEPITGYCLNCWVNWTTFGLIGAGGIMLIGSGIWLRRRVKKGPVKPAEKKPAPLKKTSAEKKPSEEKKTSADAPAKKIGLSRRCSRCSQLVSAGKTLCPACGTSL